MVWCMVNLPIPVIACTVGGWTIEVNTQAVAQIITLKINPLWTFCSISGVEDYCRLGQVQACSQIYKFQFGIAHQCWSFAGLWEGYKVGEGVFPLLCFENVFKMACDFDRFPVQGVPCSPLVSCLGGLHNSIYFKLCLSWPPIVSRDLTPNYQSGAQMHWGFDHTIMPITFWICHHNMTMYYNCVLRNIRSVIYHVPK